MSFSDGYYTDMSKSSVSDRQLTAALAGTEAADPDVIDEFVRGLRAEVEIMGLPQDSESHILAATAAVPETVPQVVAAHVPVRARRLRARLALVMASTMALLLATAGVGLAVDGAAPGDSLYGLDLAMERVGIGNGKANERLAEAVALAEAGQLSRGLDHAAVTVATLPDQAQAAVASEALADAAARLLEDGDTPTGVSDLLSDLASVLGTGEASGDGVIPVDELEDAGEVVKTFEPRVQDELAEGLTEESLPVEYSGADEECGVSGVIVAGPNGQINHGQFLKAARSLFDIKGQGCIVRYLAKSTIGRTDATRLSTSDVDPPFEIGETGDINFATFEADCSRGKSGNGLNAEMTANSRPESAGKSGDAPGHNK